MTHLHAVKSLIMNSSQKEQSENLKLRLARITAIILTHSKLITFITVLTIAFATSGSEKKVNLSPTSVALWDAKIF